MDGLVATVAAALVALPLAACASGNEAKPSVSVAPLYAPAATADIGRLDAAIQRFARERAGRLPTSLDELAAEKSLDGDLYIRRVPSDPWGRPYSYAVTSTRAGLYDLRSYGADRQPGTEDDVVARAAPVMPQ